MSKGMTWTGVLVFILGMTFEGVVGCVCRFIPGAIAAGVVAAVGLVTVGYGECTEVAPK